MAIGKDPTEAHGEGWSVSASPQYVPVGDRLVPSWIEVLAKGDASTPSFFGRIEVRDGAPRVVAFSFHAEAGEGEVRQADLRGSQVAGILQLAAVFSFQFQTLDNGTIGVESGHAPDGSISPDALSNIAGSRKNRKVTPAFLAEIAEVYRSHIDEAPTRAIRDRYFVSPRMASSYVTRARAQGYLPPTTKGKKKA